MLSRVERERRRRRINRQIQELLIQRRLARGQGWSMPAKPPAPGEEAGESAA